jgi:hypothetical protein
MEITKQNIRRKNKISRIKPGQISVRRKERKQQAKKEKKNNNINVYIQGT